MNEYADIQGVDLESASFMASPAMSVGSAAVAAPSPPCSAPSGCEEGAAGGAEKKEKKDKGDPETANARAKVAQAAECGVVGVHDSTEVVQSEVGCLKLWRDRTHTLLLHKDCLCEMIRQNTSTVVLMPEASAGEGREFPECIRGEIPVAIRVPKDDTQEKEKKDKKEKKLKYPKYAFFRGRVSWPIGDGTTVTVEGVHLGWTLRTAGKMPCGCAPATEDLGLPEPLELLSVDDVRGAVGPPPEEGEDPDAKDFLLVSLKQRRSASWKIGHFIVRTIIELVAVYLFMSFLGSEPDTYTAIKSKPWDTEPDHTFSMPGLFEWPQRWRGPGLRPIWSMYMGTFLFFFGLRILIAVLWALLPVRSGAMKLVRHFFAALYPVAVSLPLVLYLVYLTAAVVACKQCSLWRCGAYAVTGHHLQLDVPAFEAAGGCAISGVHQLYAFRQFVHATEKNLTEHEHCSFNRNGLLDLFGISLDTSERDPGDTCEPRVETDAALDEVILKEMDALCGTGFTSRLQLERFEVTPRDRARLPWSMFAHGLQIKNNASCPKTGEGWDGSSYIYFEPNAGPPADGVPQSGICVCRSAHGSRDCYRRTEGTVDRCSHFTAVPQAYGGLLQFDSVPGFSLSLSSVLTVVVPVFALFTIKAWDDIPLAGMDKFDVRLQSRMKLDVLDFFVFFLFSALLDGSDNSLPLVKFIFPDKTWHDFELEVWCIAWGSAFLWWSLTIFVRMVDADPDKTPKKWKNIQQIFEDVEQTAEALAPSRIADPYATAIRKQSVLYEKELQKIIKKRTVVDILDAGVSYEESRPWHWKRSIIVFSSPKVKDLTQAHFENGLGEFTLYVAGAWPWSAKPPANVWKAESWEEFIAHAEDEVCGEETPPGLQKVTLAFDEVLLRVRQGSPYFWFDIRYLGWCYLCGGQPRAEYKKLKEEDHRVAPGDRIQGYSEVYYNKVKFDFFERNMEFIGACRSLFVDLLFLIARLARGFWGGGFNGSISLLLVMKNCIFGLFGVVFVLTCGNTRHSCGPCRSSPAELLAKCIERTKIGNAIKLSMLMPLRICIESTSCGFRLSAENRQAFLSQRLHVVALRRTRVAPGADTTYLDHEIRLLAGQVDEYQDLIEMLETKNIVRMRAKIRAKDIIG